MHIVRMEIDRREQHNAADTKATKEDHRRPDMHVALRWWKDAMS
jgi:hypothetical protein